MEKELKLNQKIYSLLLAFVIGGIIGFIYEEIFYKIDLGYFVWRGSTFGPWIPVYGFGSVVLAIITEKVKKHPFWTFALCLIGSFVLEFGTGFVLDKVFGLRLWNYYDEIWNWGNIGGYVCFRSIALFTLAGMFLRYTLLPLLEKFVVRIGDKKATILSISLSSLFILDIIAYMIVTYFIK